MNTIDLVRIERERQISEEKYDAKHDGDEFHKNGELAMAACYYAWPEEKTVFGWDSRNYDPDIDNIRQEQITPLFFFPLNWTGNMAKRDSKDRKRQLIVAAALLCAKIDRLRMTENKE